MTKDWHRMTWADKGQSSMLKNMDTSPAIPVRNVRFAVDDQVPRHWYGGQRAITSFFNNLSLFFPPGERFFVAAVNHYKDRVHDDPKLRSELKAFCAQEGFHSREHVRYNRMLQAQGYPARAMEQRIERILRLVTRVLTPRLRLSATCALEHFTATLAHCLLSNTEFLGDAHPVMAALWRWHAAEENEHKAVAYDVFRKIGGTYFQRVSVMFLATLIFWPLVVGHQVRLMRADRTLFALREWGSLLNYLWLKPGMLRKMWGFYLDYYRPGFHPWQLDNRHLLTTWQTEYESTSPHRAADPLGIAAP